MAGNSNLPTENINDVILRLLKLKSGEELDYQTYLSIIKKRLALHRMAGFKVPAEEDQLLRTEFKRVSKLKDKGRFKVAERKTKVSSPPPGSRKPGDSGPSGPKGPNGRGPNGPKTTSIVKTPKGKLSTEKFFYEPGVEKVKVKDVTQKTVKVKKDKDCLCSKELQSIDKKLDSIIESLTGTDKENKKRSEKERKESERKRRGEREKGLEAKPFETIKKAVSKMLKPFESVWDIIKNFIFNVILGRIVLKLLDWFSKKENREKFQSIIRFLGDHWPTLLALYLRFGTGLGRFIGKLGGVLIKGAFKIGAWAARLAARAGLKGAGKVAGFLGGKKGKAIATGLGIAADVAVTAGAAVGIEKFMGGGKEEKTPPTQQFSGGGSVKVPKFAGGGFNFKGMLGGAGMGAMFGPLGMLLGGAFGSGKPQEMMSGFVSGEKGVDKVPAMLSDGEFVMSRGAVAKYGVDTLEAMNAAGGGTNKPKIISGTTYAAGGGYIGESNEPFSKNPIGAIKRFIDYKFGVDINKKSTWGPPTISQASTSQGIAKSIPTGSLLTNPIQAMSRIASRSGMKMPGLPGGGAFKVGPYDVEKRVQYEINKVLYGNRGGGSSSGSGGGAFKVGPYDVGKRLQYEANRVKNFFTGSGDKPKPSQFGTDRGQYTKDDKGDVLGGLMRQQYREAGSVYGRSLLGNIVPGMGGDITEKDFSAESQKLLMQAIKRAESRQAQKIAKARAELAKDPTNKTKQSVLKRLEQGQVQLEYGDYASKITKDNSGKQIAHYTKAEDDLKNILGQAWFQKQKGGGYRSTNEKYDFQKYNAPLLTMLGVTNFENKDVKKSGVNFQKRLEAIHQIASDPLSIFGKGAADFVNNNKTLKSIKDSPIGAMLGIRGTAKDLGVDVMLGGKRPEDSAKNRKSLEAKRPWWDKAGWFGGGSRVAQEQAKKAKIAKSKPVAKPVKPPMKPKSKVVMVNNKNSSKKSTNKSGAPKTPSFSASHGKTNTAKKTLGVNKK